MLAIFLAGTSAILAVPRPVDPTVVPEPTIIPRVLAQAARADDDLAAQAEAEAAHGDRLGFDVRTLGSAIRSYGQADAAGRDTEVVVARRDVAEAGKRALAHGDDALLRLRAYQLRLFLRALRHWEAKGVETADLRELGGAFISMSQHNGWVKDGVVVMDDAVRRAMFKKRWNELTLARGGRFELSIDEQRALYRFLIRRPPNDESEAPAAVRALRSMKQDERAAFVTEQYRLRKIDELAALDATYPADLARGVVFYRMRRYPVAMELFRRHLDAHPDGPFTLRAQNYLRAALGHAADETP
ncbi:Hypothetical protein A7982_07596 [Minicystis rosea]|nr:Hypothetical protein A7982_07596 [Minicystis rosea]